jgi:hypothetical protein
MPKLPTVVRLVAGTAACSAGRRFKPLLRFDRTYGRSKSCSSPPLTSAGFRPPFSAPSFDSDWAYGCRTAPALPLLASAFLTAVARLRVATVSPSESESESKSESEPLLSSPSLPQALNPEPLPASEHVAAPEFSSTSRDGRYLQRLCPQMQGIIRRLTRTYRPTRPVNQDVDEQKSNLQSRRRAHTVLHL